MKFQITGTTTACSVATLLVVAATSPMVEAFSVIHNYGRTTTPGSLASMPRAAAFRPANRPPTTTTLWYTNGEEQQTIEKPEEVLPVAKPSPSESDEDSDVAKLRVMAAKYRAEAAALEAERADELATQAQKAFEKFDLDRDGEISVAELKDGLETQLKTELTDDKVMKLMAKFDASGDGKLQMEEFVDISRFHNALEEFAREEKKYAQEKRQQAQMEEEVSKMLEQQLEGINDGPPTPVEKVVSVLPYLLPLLDSLPYASNLVLSNQDNPIAQALTAMYVVYQSIPLGGFVAFFALSTLAGNLGINRLVRYNMLQAIYTDIALFFPGIVAALVGLVANATNQQVPPELVAMTSNAIFFTMLASLSYSVGSSLLGQEPDKLPIISEMTNRRMPPSKDVLRDEIEKSLPWKKKGEKNDKEDDVSTN